MADTKISALTSGTPIATDIVPYVSDPGGAPTTKQTTVSTLLAPTGPVLLEEHTAAASATLDFLARNKNGYTGATFQSDFDEYRIELINLVPATNAVNCLWRASTDGVSFDTGNNYEWVGFRASKAGSAAAGATATSSVGLDGSSTIVNTVSVGGLIGTLTLFSPVNTTFQKRFRGETGANDGSANPDIVIMLHGVYTVTASAVVGFRVLMSSGNITSGTVRVYGVRK